MIQKHYDLMKKDEFDWIHEQQVNKLNFDTIKEILNEFLKLDSRWEDKNFIDFTIFRKVNSTFFFLIVDFPFGLYLSLFQKYQYVFW